MFEFKKLTHKDYDDIVDISKDIWEGSDYLPELFHKWVEDQGYFLGVVDSEENKVVAVGKFSILKDGSGWLEGLRAHSAYRGKKLGRMVSERLIEIAKEALKDGIINKIAFSSHTSNKESITLMGKLGFKLSQSQVLITKELDTHTEQKEQVPYHIEEWSITYEEFCNLNLLKKRDSLFPLAFVFQQPTRELFNELIDEKAFLKINGYRGISKLKGEVNFIVEDESLEGIKAFMHYYLQEQKLNGLNAASTPFTYVLEQDQALLQELKMHDFVSWYDWKPDYLYFVFMT